VSVYAGTRESVDRFSERAVFTARIPDEEIERLKKEIPIERLVTGFGVELKRQGKDLFGRCPFHDDRTPSLSVSPETNLWHCLGACNSGGDVIAWVMKTRG
jgi:DNA primase